MSELDDDLDPEVEAATEAPSDTRSDADWKKLQQENRSLRSRLRRTEIEAKHGKDVAELIPDELPLTKWEEFAEKLAAKTQAERPVVPEQTETPETPKVEPTAEETRLAAAADTTPPPSTQTSVATAAEIGELMRTNPAEGLKVAQRKYGTPAA